jgi:hypothetical protein
MPQFWNLSSSDKNILLKKTVPLLLPIVSVLITYRISS